MIAQQLSSLLFLLYCARWSPLTSVISDHLSQPKSTQDNGTKTGFGGQNNGTAERAAEIISARRYISYGLFVCPSQHNAAYSAPAVAQWQWGMERSRHRRGRRPCSAFSGPQGLVCRCRCRVIVGHRFRRILFARFVAGFSYVHLLALNQLHASSLKINHGTRQICDVCVRPPFPPIHDGRD